MDQALSITLQDFESAFVTQLPAVRSVPVTWKLALNLDYRIIMNLGSGGAQQPALRAQRFNGLPIFAVAFDGIMSSIPIVDRPCGTDLKACAAPEATGFFPARIKVQPDKILWASIVKIEDMGPGNFRTGPHAPPA